MLSRTDRPWLPAVLRGHGRDDGPRTRIGSRARSPVPSSRRCSRRSATPWSHGAGRRRAPAQRRGALLGGRRSHRELGGRPHGARRGPAGPGRVRHAPCSRRGPAAALPCWSRMRPSARSPAPGLSTRARRHHGRHRRHRRRQLLQLGCEPTPGSFGLFAQDPASSSSTSRRAASLRRSPTCSSLLMGRVQQHDMPLLGASWRPRSGSSPPTSAPSAQLLIARAGSGRAPSSARSSEPRRDHRGGFGVPGLPPPEPAGRRGSLGSLSLGL